MSLFNRTPKTGETSVNQSQEMTAHSSLKYTMVQHLKTAFMSSTTTFILTMHFLSASYADTKHIEQARTKKQPIKSILQEQIIASSNSNRTTLLSSSAANTTLQPEMIEESKEAQALQSAKNKTEQAIKNADLALTKITQELIQSKQERLEIKQKLSSLKEVLDNQGDLSNIPEWVNSPIFRRLLEKQYSLNNEFDLVKMSLMPAHPRYKRLAARVKTLNKQIYNELFKVRIRLRQRMTSAIKTEHKLSNSLETLTKKHASAKQDRKKLESLSRVAELSLVKAEKTKIEERTKMFNTALEQHGQNLLTSSENSSPRLTQLLDQYIDMNMELAAMSTKWADSHPRILQAKQNRNLLKQQIEDLARKNIAQMDNTAKSLSSKEETLEKQARDIAQQEVREIKEKARKKAALEAMIEQKLNSIAPPKATSPNGLSLAYGRRGVESIQVDTKPLLLP